MEEHVDALYKVVHTATPAASTQALMLLFHLAVGSTTGKVHEHLPSEADTQRQDRFYRALYVCLSKPSLVSHGKHLTMFFNLLYKAMKYDSDDNRVNACAKRLMSTALHSGAATIASCIFLLNEIVKTHPSLRICILEAPTESNSHLVLDDTKRDPRSALVMGGEEYSEDSEKQDSEKKEGVKCAPLWELALVAHHTHPSVSKFASTIGSIAYTGDPLKDFMLAPFLDKFAYRNPKTREKLAGHYKRGQSIAERRSGTENQIQSRLALPVNDPAFLETEDVSEQDEFFHTFFVERARRDEIKGITKKAETDDMDEDEPVAAEETVVDAAEEAVDAAEEDEDVDIGTKAVSCSSDTTLVRHLLPLLTLHF
jgi:ribosome biogenesis protein MAK21